MRQQSKVQVTVRKKVIGGTKPLICLPLVGETGEDILQEAKGLIALHPDLLEWRIDAYEKVENITDCLTVLQKLRQSVVDIPLIFTCRIDVEGGLKKITQEKRLELLCATISSGNIDIVDIELCNGEEFIEVIKEQAAKNNVKVILSYHNFKETPSEAFMYSKLVEAQTAGADIAKLAAMPHNYADVLTLLSATNKARNERVEVPIVTMSMGEEGAISRLAGGLFGSDITFAIGLRASAPGQIPIDGLRTGMSLLYKMQSPDI
jgi:3-dehydroquinate dehydratase-1